MKNILGGRDKVSDLYAEKPWKAPRFRPAREEIREFLKKKRLPITKKTITRARAKLRKRNWKKSLPTGRDVAFTEGDAPRQVIYGTCRVGGLISFFTTTNSNRDAHFIVSLAGHEVNSVTKLFLDDVEVPLGAPNDQSDHPYWATNGYPYGSRVFMNATTKGADSQSVNADATGQLPSLWTSDHRQRGVAHVYHILRWNKNVFAEGLPDFTYEVQGKKVYDPRTASTAFSSNAALCIADYLMNDRFGMGIPLAQLDTGTDPGGLQWAADICDETASGENRYEINYAFEMGAPHKVVLEEMVAAMGGHLTYVEGKWRFWPAKWVAPSITLTEDDLRGALTVRTLNSRRDIFNAVRGTYVSGEKDYEVTDYPVVSNGTYESTDGERIYEEINQPAVTSGIQCQRLAKIELERIRQGINVSGLFSLKAYQLQVPNNVYLTLDRFGWSAKTFEVKEMELIQGEPGGEGITVYLDLMETASGVFDWANGEETTIDLSPNTNLPSPFDVPDISGLTVESGTDHLDVRSDGTIFTRIYVEWDAITDTFTSDGGIIEVQYKKSAASTWQVGARVSGDVTSAYILDVKDGVNYDVRARAISALEVQGDFTTVSAHLVVGKTEPPSDVLGFGGSVEKFGIRLSWDQISDLDKSHYEIREGASWDAGDLVVESYTTAYLWQIKQAGTYNLWIKAVDTSGNYSDTAAQAIVTITAPNAPVASYELKDSFVEFSWTEPASQFPIGQYEIRYGASWAAGTIVATASGLGFKTRVNWGGTRSFWIKAIDVAGNYGEAEQLDVTIVVPSEVQGLAIKTVDNNVLIDWDAPASGSLPISTHKVYKGDTFGAAELLGQVDGTFLAYIETLGGLYTYWVTALDSAGNEGDESGLQVNVFPPPDYILEHEQTLDFATDDTTLTKAIENAAGDGFYAPVNATETWAEHFTNNSFDQISDFIGAGYDYWLQPTLDAATDAGLEWNIDLGAVLPQNIIKVTWVEVPIDGICDITPTISVRETELDPWTDFVDQSQVNAQNFQFIKITLNVDAQDDTGLTLIKNIHLQVDVKVQSDEGVASIDASDTGSGYSDGTEVIFAKDFLDVKSINVSVNAAGTAQALFPIVNFEDVANPTSFRVIVFDKDGVRQDSEVRWIARGVLDAGS